MAEHTSARRPRKSGRPHKGDRHLFQCRVPRELAEEVMAAAEQAGITYSDYLAILVAEKHGYRLPDYYPRIQGEADQAVQEEIPMKTAS